METGEQTQQRVSAQSGPVTRLTAENSEGSCVLSSFLLRPDWLSLHLTESVFIFQRLTNHIVSGLSIVHTAAFRPSTHSQHEDNGVVLVFIVWLGAVSPEEAQPGSVSACRGSCSCAECLLVCLLFNCCSLVFTDGPIRLFTLSSSVFYVHTHAGPAAEPLQRINTRTNTSSDQSCAATGSLCTGGRGGKNH